MILENIPLNIDNGQWYWFFKTITKIKNNVENIKIKYLLVEKLGWQLLSIYFC